jgi:hypothetical protein
MPRVDGMLVHAAGTLFKVILFEVLNEEEERQ